RIHPLRATVILRMRGFQNPKRCADGGKAARRRPTKRRFRERTGGKFATKSVKAARKPRVFGPLRPIVTLRQQYGLKLQQPLHVTQGNAYLRSKKARLA
ncbi:MAG: hypothetical protein ABWZ83_06140, partial [Mesorhizobium sp.]